ncbi:MAG TPA: hypothetical protein VF556_08710 [Pyrinomonadaceae bacterium]|jgi:hypothetical protein
MKFNKNQLLFFVLICSLTITINAQKTLEKPYQKWSKSDAMKILTASAWAQTYQSPEASALAAQQEIRREQGQTATRGGNDPKSTPRDFGQPPVVIRLHSALPVRQALVRIRQIESGYDKMDEKQRADFDKSSRGFLDCAICKNFYVITLTKFIDSSGQYVDEGIFQRMEFEQLKNNVWLVNEKGERRNLIQFNPPKTAADMAVFYFARVDDKGISFLTPESKKFEFVFNNGFLDSRNPYTPMLPRRFEFNVTKLIVDGNLLF